MYRRMTWVVLLLAAASLLLTANVGSSTKQGPNDSRLAHSFRRPDLHGWTYVHLEGTPEQIGFQHGYWLSPEIDRMLKTFRVTIPRESGQPWSFFRDAAEHMLLPHIEAEYRTELEGIVTGLHARGIDDADLDDVVVLNAFEELPDYYVPWYVKTHHVAAVAHPVAPGNCSAFVATGSYTRDGRIVIAHNNWTSYYRGENWTIIFDIVPSSGLHIFMDGFPGVITSDDDFGINSAGMITTETTITQFEGWDPNGIPEFVRSRKALQYARSIDDYVRIMLDGDNGGYANDWLLADRKNNEIALFELGLKHHRVWRTRDGMYFGSNFPLDPELIRDETPKFDVHDLTTSPNARRARWEQLKRDGRGKIDLALAEQWEADHWDTVTRTEHPSEHTLCGHADLAPHGIPEWEWGPHHPGGTVQAKATDWKLSGEMAFYASAGHPCGIDFKAAPFFRDHPEYSYLKPFLRDMPSQPWTLFRAAE